jgi:hypothetical protein
VQVKQNFKFNTVAVIKNTDSIFGKRLQPDEHIQREFPARFAAENIVRARVHVGDSFG